MRQMTWWAVVTVGMALTAGSSCAQINYEFADSFGVAQSNFAINSIGGTVQIQIYLHELTAGSPILSGSGGLASTGVRLTYNNPGGIAAVQNLTTDVTPAPGWDFTTTNGSNIATDAALAMLSFTGIKPDTDGRILIGTFTLHGLSAGTTTLSAIDTNPDSNSNTTLFFPPTGIDSMISPATASLTVVPEPVFCIGFAAASLVGLSRFRARKRRSESTAGLSM